MPDDGSVEAGAGEVWLGGRDEQGRPIPVSCSALEQLLVDLDSVLPPPGAPQPRRLDWLATRAILLDLLARGLSGSDPHSARLASGLVEETLAEAGLEFAPTGRGRRREPQRPEPDPRAPSGPSAPHTDGARAWRPELDALLGRYRAAYPGCHPRRVRPAAPPRSTDPLRYRRYFRLTDATLGHGPAVDSQGAAKAVWQAHRAEQLEAVAVDLFVRGQCGADLARRAAAGARAAVHGAGTAAGDA